MIVFCSKYGLTSHGEKGRTSSMPLERISAALAERLSVLAYRLGYYYILMTGNLFVKESSSIISYCTLLNCLNFVTSQLEGTLKSCF